jgi:hypothetical protein
MRVLHVCFCSYTLLTESRALYSAGKGNKSTDAVEENWRSAQFVCNCERKIGALRGSQLRGPYRLASGLPLRGTLPFGGKKEFDCKIILPWLRKGRLGTKCGN